MVKDCPFTHHFENKAMISKILWDIHSHNAKKFYINNNTKYDSTLEVWIYYWQT